MSDVVFGFFATVAFIVIILFDVGIVTPYWITVEETIPNSTRSCTHGLFYSLGCPGNETVFDNLVIGLNIATSLCLTIFPLFWICIRCIICCRSSDGKDNSRECTDSCCKCYSLPYTLAGLLGFASVLTVVVKFGLKQLRWSFYRTVASTSVILVQTVLLIVYSVRSRNTDEKCTIFLVYRRRHSSKGRANNFKRLKA
ncbi:uncharacterized protein LOC134241178 [Saccostrea cucullata]|uniref:uncharacterized protein LOC134241178 n=1 Tax=Saccostrea cuccullata TaxID=36930 RepID=UPI002ED0CCF4